MQQNFAWVLMGVPRELSLKAAHQFPLCSVSICLFWTAFCLHHSFCFFFLLLFYTCSDRSSPQLPMRTICIYDQQLHKKTFPALLCTPRLRCSISVGKERRQRQHGRETAGQQYFETVCGWCLMEQYQELHSSMSLLIRRP